MSAHDRSSPMGAMDQNPKAGQLADDSRRHEARDKQALDKKKYFIYL